MDNLLIRISKYLTRAATLDEDQEEIILYALRLIYSGIGGFLWIVILAWLVGVLPYAILSALSNAYLRVKAGGGHASFPGSCFAIGAFVFTGIGLVVKYTPKDLLTGYLFISVVLTYFITLWVIKRYAPADTPAKPLSDERKVVLKKKTIRGHLSMFIVFFAFYVIQRIYYPLNNWLTLKYLYAALLGIIWETFTITPAGYRLLEILDNVMIIFFRHKETINLD